MRTPEKPRAGSWLATAILVTALLLGGAPSATAAPVGAGFAITVADLQFILKQIQIAEAHATTEGPGGLGSVTPPTSLLGSGALDIPDPLLPWGLRQVDGRNNNLVTGASAWNGSEYATTGGNSDWGSADRPFPRLTDPLWRAGDPATVFGPVAPSYSPAERPANVQDAEPRLISNLISDQSPANPAAVSAAGPGAVLQVDGSLEIPNTAPNGGVAAPYNGMFVLFGQFFDHGLDLVAKTGTEAVIVPLELDDPLYVPGSSTNFMVLNRTVVDGNGDGTNLTTPWVDQNQTYTSHPSKQVFLREYELAAGVPVTTGRLADGAIAGNLVNWQELRAQAAALLGIDLVDSDVFNVPLLLTDEYGRFLRGPNGLPQIVQTDGSVVEGNLAAPVSTANSVRTGHAFLDDIAHNAVPANGKVPDADADVNDPATPRPAGTYDDELLARHFVTGDGRGNENIGLTAVHTVFHSEHNRLVTDIQNVITTAPAGSFTATDWNLAGGAWNGERLFQAARFVNEMEYQHVVFEEFVRKFQPGIRPFAAYDPTLRPDVVAEYAHAVYRFGHSQLNATVDRVAADGTDLSTPLLGAFLNPPAFNDGGAVGQLTAAEAAGAVARGMTHQIGNEIDEFVTDTLRNSLLGLPLDLPTLNMTRARDAGMDSLNGVRRSLFNQTGNPGLAPYTSWQDFEFALRHPASIVNFVAAYGTHPAIQGTVAERRVAAYKVVNGQDPGPNLNSTLDDTPLAGSDIATFADRAEFLSSTGATWAIDANGRAVTGVEAIDLWVGGLAEARNEFGGMLGSTFDYVFKFQLEQLQEGDRFYYLGRTAGTALGAQIEGNTFAEMIMRNTDAEALPFDAFAWPALTFDMNKAFATQLPPAGEGSLTLLADGTWRYGGSQHVTFNGTPGNDRMQADRGDDTLRGNDTNDWAQGGQGNDSIVGGLGHDILLDTGGADILTGGDGNDYMSGSGPGADTFNGGNGHDFVVGGVDATAILAGPGNDLLFGGQAGDGVSGGDDSDWMEGSTGADGLTGDEIAPFGVDLGSPGDDVLIGDSGDDIADGTGGLDISFGGAGVDTFLGGFGFDWQTYYDPTTRALPANADLTIFAPAPGDILAGLMDGFQDAEALSGGDLDDTLRGDNFDSLAAPIAGFTHALVSSDIPKIAGLQDLLGAGSTGWDSGNILIGGDGSDLLEGRGGNDLVHGDAWLTARLSVPPTASGVLNGVIDPVTGRIVVTSMLQVRPAVLNGSLSPADVTIERTIDLGAHAAETDVAVFTGNAAGYVITPTGPSTLTVADGTVGRDGLDTLVGVEVLRFADGDVPAPAVPGAPTIGTATAGDGEATVTWTAPASDGGSAVTGYEIEVVATGGGTTTVPGIAAGATSHVVPGLTNGTEYTFRVLATNAVGPGPYSASSNAVTPVAVTAPGAPTIGTATAGDGEATVTWTAPASDGGSAVTGYEIEVVATGGGTTTVPGIAAGATSHVVPGLTNGTEYTFRVLATNAVGPGPYSASSNAVTPVAAATAPGAPTIGTAIPGNAAVSVAWSAPPSDGGAPITSYEIEVSSPGGTSVVTGISPAWHLRVVTGLTNGAEYTFRVRAVNSVGAGAFSALSNPATPDAVASFFTDVPNGAAFFANIEWLHTNGITRVQPQPDGTLVFGAADSITREAMAAFVYRLLGEPAFTPPTTSPFTDLAPGAAFYHEITWLESQGIAPSTGPSGEATFRPVDLVTREVMALWLFRAVADPAFVEPATSPFTDVQPGDPAYREIAWMGVTGISVGVQNPDGVTRSYVPADPIRREAMAYFFHQASALLP